MIDEFVRTCCDCKAIYNPIMEQWMQKPKLYAHYIKEFGRMSHGYCPVCYTNLMNEIDKDENDS